MSMRPRELLAIAAIGAVLLVAGCGQPEGPAGPAPPVVSFDLGKDTTCAVVVGGGLHCWGDNAFTSTSQSASNLDAPRRTRPARVLLGGAAISVSLGRLGGCAAIAGAPIECWAMTPPSGSLGPVGVAEPSLATATQVSVAGHRICAVEAGGTGRCVVGEHRKTAEIEIAAARQVCAGALHACWIDGDGVAWCQGRMGWDLRAFEPRRMTTGVVDVACGASYGCLATASGLAACWGDNDLERGRTGFAGAPAETIRRDPDIVPGLEGVVDIAAGDYHTCAVHDGGRVSCWGHNDFGQLGGPGRGPTPVGVAGITDAVAVEVGEWHTCALRRTGGLMCWGRNQRGQLGDGTTEDRHQPVAVRW